MKRLFVYTVATLSVVAVSLECQAKKHHHESTSKKFWHDLGHSILQPKPTPPPPPVVYQQPVVVQPVVVQQQDPEALRRQAELEAAQRAAKQAQEQAEQQRRELAAQESARKQREAERQKIAAFEKRNMQEAQQEFKQYLCGLAPALKYELLHSGTFPGARYEVSKSPDGQVFYGLVEKTEIGKLKVAVSRDDVIQSIGSADDFAEFERDQGCRSKVNKVLGFDAQGNAVGTPLHLRSFADQQEVVAGIADAAVYERVVLYLLDNGNEDVLKANAKGYSAMLAKIPQLKLAGCFLKRVAGADGSAKSLDLLSCAITDQAILQKMLVTDDSWARRESYQNAEAVYRGYCNLLGNVDDDDLLLKLCTEVKPDSRGEENANSIVRPMAVKGLCLKLGPVKKGVLRAAAKNRLVEMQDEASIVGEYWIGMDLVDFLLLREGNDDVARFAFSADGTVTEVELDDAKRGALAGLKDKFNTYKRKVLKRYRAVRKADH